MNRKYIAAKASWQAIGGKRTAQLILEDGLYHWDMGTFGTVGLPGHNGETEYFASIAEANLFLACRLLNPEVRTLARMIEIKEY
jgi:hypothetical protein